MSAKPPLRSELFSIEQMDQHAQQIAASHRLSKKSAPELLLKRLAENEKILFEVIHLLHDDIRDKKNITPAGEWLLDNFYLIEEQILIGKRHLPKGYSKGLPRLDSGSLAGFPRIYDIVIQIISHSDGRVDINSLGSFISSYQKVHHLTLGELWALPIVLRLALLENLSRVAAQIAVDRNDASLAGEWAARVIKTVEENPRDLVLIIADMARSKPPMVSAFVAEFSRMLQWKGLDLSLPLTWLEQHLFDMGSNINLMVLAENQKQAADQLSMSNSINSLRFLAKTDWRDFIEAMSIVEHTLQDDINGVYGGMDFHTRDSYRHAVERIAKYSDLSEHEVSLAAINLAQVNFTKDPSDKRMAHVGYYLIGTGRILTEQIAQMNLPAGETFRKISLKSKRALYFIITLLITSGICIAFIYKAEAEGLSTNWLVVVGVLSLLAGSYFGLMLVNWLATIWVRPKPLPKMNFTKGIPAGNMTAVVVPTIIGSKDQTEKILEDLEVRYLANRDRHLLFALLTDFKDAPSETMDDDDMLISFVRSGIKELNQKYGRKSSAPFFLFHRTRQWNAKEKIWMGYERKRGKLTELNHLLRGKAKDRFSVIVGREKIYSQVKYIITLDTDTQLPRDAAQKLVGMMAHPLNQPVYDEKKKRITQGYAIIQPRIAISLHGAIRSRYARMHEIDSGIDPYTRVTSDVYQDVFEEGSFIGKGIYDVDVFERTLNDRFPENRILSHDLLEGSYARCGLASDVQFYEEYPSRYSMDIARHHRWIRGDWQIGNWFLPFVPNKENKLCKNSISALSRWKIFDNLRRSLIPIAFFTLFVLTWTVLTDVWFWTFILTSLILTPSIITSVWNTLRKPPEIGRSQHWKNSFKTTYRDVLQIIFFITCLPYEAFVSIDAIGRTLWRVFISQKKLLEWNPSGFVAKANESLLETYRKMWVAPIIVTAILYYLFKYNPQALLPALPFLLAWFVSPAVVWWVSKPPASFRTRITTKQKDDLRLLSRKTWAFFEQFIGPEDNWLPPDNFQEFPFPVVAHRTSPTNIGLSLLGNLTAHDFGYLTTAQLMDRTANTFSTLEKLDRYQGHFYNWVDTKTLQTLHPRYISTVDSGNFAGHLLTLRQGFLSLPDQPIIELKLVDGFYDTLRALIDFLQEKHIAHPPFIKDFEAVKLASTPSLADWKVYLDKLCHVHGEARLTIESYQTSELLTWFEALGKQLQHALEELLFLAPWLASPTAPDKFNSVSLLSDIPTLNQLAVADKELVSQLENIELSAFTKEEKNWFSHFKHYISLASTHARERIKTILKLAVQCYEFADAEYAFLYDKSQHLLAIGYNVDTHHRDTSYYDLLASEARLALFVTIAQGKLPQESWFALGRRLTIADNTPVLLSWSGSMFEYLMPALVMPTYENTLLDETCRGTVKRQIEYGRQQGLPWGISESCYNLVDANLTYQYRAFGVPGMGFKRGLGLDFVVAPYATMLSLMVDPKAACQNLAKLREKGFEGTYGFYEAIDYTPSRLPRDKDHVVIQTFMAHHQGMSFLSLAYLLLNQPMQKRFEADPEFQTSLLLLQEQVPKVTGFYAASAEMEDVEPISSEAQIRILNTTHSPQPEIQLLSNGRYHVMVTNTGGGYSRWRDMAVTRWREDATCDNWGTFCYIRNVDTNEFWSNAYQPTLKEPSSYMAVFSQGRMEFRRRDKDIETYTEIIVSPEDDVEIRRIHITNRSRKKQNLESTSYAEVVLALPITDASHPAFSNLFVQTEILDHQQAILCTRRPRSKNEQPPWMFHIVKINTSQKHITSYETDRLKFIGRGHGIEHPRVMDAKGDLSGSQGSVLDPIVSIRNRISLEPDEVAVVDIITGIADSREISQSLVDRYQEKHMRDRAFELSWTHSHVILRQINATQEEAELYGRLAGAVLYNNPLLRANAEVIANNFRGQSALWSYSISGDLPIVLLQISDISNIILARQLIQAQAYWHFKGLVADLVILNEDPGSYRQVLQDQIQALIAAGIGTATIDKPGRIFVRPADQISAEDLILLKAVARVIISDRRGTLMQQINRSRRVKNVIPYIEKVSAHRYRKLRAKMEIPDNLLFYNGHGGFSPDGKEYVIIRKQNHTPLPWVNIIANKNFGSIITESGPAYTWSENAHGYRLTPWKNDPVTDISGEAYYLRDEESGAFWSPMPNPAGSQAPYITKHGFGYSKFEHQNDGIFTEVTTYVDLEEAIKFVVIRTTNYSEKLRKLTLTGYTEWVLSNLRSKSAMHIVIEIDSQTGTMIASNAYNSEFPGWVAFFDVDDSHYGFTTDRTEFIGRNGTLKKPEAMKRIRLSGKSGAGHDPCSAIQLSFDLEPGRYRESIFRMGAGKSRQQAVETILQFRGRKAASQSLEKVKAFWEYTLSAIQIETPDAALNVLTNGWLVYQALACRLWGRSGFYQSGGAFGFRDQLQDVLALMHAEPNMTREHILLAASRQFIEGDVQHWWHPPMGRGVRTLCSDDFIWLPYVTSRYVATTGDQQILQEVIPFLEGRALNPHEESYYDLPAISGSKATLYDHCKRALEHGLKFGVHGLPFMGSGDWNDGMNMVGIEGKGESVWLGFFLYDVLNRFIPIAGLQGDEEFKTVCKINMTLLKKNINKNAWDGNWYRRAYFDDGTPLGSASNEECKIDSISQSWAIISGAGKTDRSLLAMESVNKYLINRDKGLLQLLEPPFDKADMDPGYIKGYVPGVRENGGQYTHAAIWMVMAFAKIGDQYHTWELLNMINPINHGKSAADISVYKAEPYVMAADVYGVHPHTGRGGWTWYTGSAGWMYQLIIETFLGLNKAGNKLWFNPCIPADWTSFKMHYRYKDTTYHIEVTQSIEEENVVILDGVKKSGKEINLVDDRKEHTVLVRVKSGK